MEKFSLHRVRSALWLVFRYGDLKGAWRELTGRCSLCGGENHADDYDCPMLAKYKDDED